MLNSGSSTSRKQEIAVMNKLRKDFKKEFSDSDFKALILGGRQLDLLAGMKNFKEERGIQSLRNSLAFSNSMKGRKDIVEIFESYLDKGLPDKQEYLRDMSRIRKVFKDDSAQRPDEYEIIDKYLKSPGSPVAPPSMSPQEEIESAKMIKEEKRAKMMAEVEVNAMGEVEAGKNPNFKPSSSSSSSSSAPKADIPNDMPVPPLPPGREKEESHVMPDGTKMTGSTHNEMSVPLKQEEGKSVPKIESRSEYVLPLETSKIPPSRLSPSFKDVNDLNSDIKYFFSNFGNLLTREKAIYKKIKKNDKPNLIKLHSRITGRLNPGGSGSGSSGSGGSGSGKKVGVVLDAQEYIRSEMKRLMENNTFSNMKPSDVVVDLGYNEEPKDPNVKDYGDFEVKRNAEGGLSSRREAIYRYTPTEGDDKVGLENKSFMKRKKPRRLANIPLKQINEATTAERQVKRNPFSRNVKTVKLKYLY